MKFDDTRETYSKVATLFYIGGQSHVEIAKMFDISRFKVARVLKRCRDLNIIEFRINSKPCYYENMEAEIEKLLKIKKCIIVGAGTTEDDSKKNVGKVAAKYLTTSLKKGMMVGFDWGSTLQTMVSDFSPASKYDDCMFIQISGSIASQSLEDHGFIDGNEIVKNLAERAGANWSLFPVPYIVKEKILRDMLMEEKSIKSHISNFDKLDMAFFGVGSSHTDAYLSFYKSFLQPAECITLENEDNTDTGDLLSCRLDMEGNVKESLLTGRVMTIDLNTLKHVPETVALAAGENKVISLIASARGGYIKTLIITEIVAMSIINYFENCGTG